MNGKPKWAEQQTKVDDPDSKYALTWPMARKDPMTITTAGYWSGKASHPGHFLKYGCDVKLNKTNLALVGSVTPVRAPRKRTKATA